MTAKEIYDMLIELNLLKEFKEINIKELTESFSFSYPATKGFSKEEWLRKLFYMQLKQHKSIMKYYDISE